MDIDNLSKRVERVSKGYAKRFRISRNETWYVLKLQEEMGELIQSYLMLSGQARKKDKLKPEIRENFEHEIADVLGHILLLAAYFKVDLEKVMQDKWLKWDA